MLIQDKRSQGNDSQIYFNGIKIFFWMPFLQGMIKKFSAKKVMASIFWDRQSVIMVDYLEEGRTKNGVYYAEELRWLHQEIVRKRRGKLTRGVSLVHDNAPAHISQDAMTAATKISLEVLPHPQHSPDSALSEIYLFIKLKTNIRG